MFIITGVHCIVMSRTILKKTSATDSNLGFLSAKLLTGNYRQVRVDTEYRYAHKASTIISPNSISVFIGDNVHIYVSLETGTVYQINRETKEETELRLNFQIQKGVPQ